jgi:hypothetical protein
MVRRLLLVLALFGASVVWFTSGDAVAADRALYMAKTAGKNCVRMASPANPSPSLVAPLVGS